MNRFDEALAPLKQALDVDRITPIATCSWAASTTHQELPGGQSVLEEAVQINPFNPVIYRLLADIYGARGDQDKAKQAKATLDKLLTPSEKESDGVH